MAFRLQGKNLWLTYPQCPLAPGEVLDLLTDILSAEGISKYIIASESHQDGSLHIHCWVGLKKKLRTRLPTFLDLPDDAGDYHGNYQICRSNIAVKKYCEKEGDFITNIKDTPGWPSVIELAKAGDVESAMDLVSTFDPRSIALNGDKLRQNLTSLAPIDLPIHNYKFQDVPDIDCWPRHHFSLWLYGPSHTGKTEFAKTLFKNPLLVSHMDGLKELRPGIHDGIIFDDCSFTHWPRSSVIHVLDLHNPRDINVKYGKVCIPAGFPRVFTSNNYIWPCQDPAIFNRISFFHIKEDIRIITEETRLPVNQFPVDTSLFSGFIFNDSCPGVGTLYPPIN